MTMTELDTKPAPVALSGGKGVVYVAGPMRGKPYFNIAAFDAAEARLRGRGWDVINPVSTDIAYYGRGMFTENPSGDVTYAVEKYGFNLRFAMARNCENICMHATAMYMLKGWELSGGALAELGLAQMLELELMYESGWES